eukprot:Amastigsp_a345711_33.p4 type:complete len:127 gc:universal Amastigsp_a345711_33:523-143(-)
MRSARSVSCPRPPASSARSRPRFPRRARLRPSPLSSIARRRSEWHACPRPCWCSLSGRGPRPQRLSPPTDSWRRKGSLLLSTSRAKALLSSSLPVASPTRLQPSRFCAQRPPHRRAPARRPTRARP